MCTLPVDDKTGLEAFRIAGLPPDFYYIPNFISLAEEASILQKVCFLLIYFLVFRLEYHVAHGKFTYPALLHAHYSISTLHTFNRRARDPPPKLCLFPIPLQAD